MHHFRTVAYQIDLTRAIRLGDHMRVPVVFFDTSTTAKGQITVSVPVPGYNELSREPARLSARLRDLTEIALTGLSRSGNVTHDWAVNDAAESFALSFAPSDKALQARALFDTVVQDGDFISCSTRGIMPLDVIEALKARNGTIAGRNIDTGLWLQDGQDIDCLVAAEDVLGNWSVVTADGRTAQYLGSEIA